MVIQRECLFYFSIFGPIVTLLILIFNMKESGCNGFIKLMLLAWGICHRSMMCLYFMFPGKNLTTCVLSNSH